jgi:hypothetical protein
MGSGLMSGRPLALKDGREVREVGNSLSVESSMTGAKPKGMWLIIGWNWPVKISGQSMCKILDSMTKPRARTSRF